MDPTTNQDQTAKAGVVTELKELLQKESATKNSPIPSSDRTLKVPEEIERKRLENEAFRQDIELKKKTLNRLFWLLAIETAVVFTFSFLQGTHWGGFALEEWSFKLLTTATLIQITTMLRIAVRHLFPTPKE